MKNCTWLGYSNSVYLIHIPQAISGANKQVRFDVDVMRVLGKSPSRTESESVLVFTPTPVAMRQRPALHFIYLLSPDENRKTFQVYNTLIIAPY